MNVNASLVSEGRLGLLMDVILPDNASSSSSSSSDDQQPRRAEFTDATTQLTVWVMMAAITACIVAFALYAVWRCLKRDHAVRCAIAEIKDKEATLPNYTLVTGLPTYDDALDQLQRRRELRRTSSAQRAIELAVAAARAAGNLWAVKKLTFRRLSLSDLIKYKFRSNSFDKS